MKNENIPIGSNAGVSTNQVCFAAWEEKEELIPCDDELNRLKEFLADFKKPTLRYTGTDHLMVGPWPDNTACGHLKNYGADNTACGYFGPESGLREEIRACWSALRDLERKRIVY